MKWFITGTDTDAGKTYVARLLVAALAERGSRVAPYKPVSCGDRVDAQLLLAASGRTDLSLDDVNPLWLKPALSPFAAGLIENRKVELAPLIQHARHLEGLGDHLIVEGAGGWEVPMTATETVADLAVQLGYPVIVVVDNKLGALNHTILTVRSIRSRGLTCAGLVLNHVRPERDAASISNRMVLESVLQIPVLAEILHDATELDPVPFLDL